MDLVQVGQSPAKFITSAVSDTSDDKGLLSVRYTRIQRASPEYSSVYEGIDQNVDVKISTFIFTAAPEPVVTLYDFIMTTFVPRPDDDVLAANSSSEGALVQAQNGQPPVATQEKIRVMVNLASVKGSFPSEK
jgi:vacuolar protein sorting-associated protein 13A/C